jgi:hypothetical protein
MQNVWVRMPLTARKQISGWSSNDEKLRICIRGTLKTRWRVTAQEQGVPQISAQPRQSQGALIFGNALLQGYTFPEVLAAFFFIFFSPYTKQVSQKKKKKRWGILKSEMVIEHFGKQNPHWSGCFSFSKFHLIMWPPNTKIQMVLYKVKNRLPRKKKPQQNAARQNSFDSL